MPLRDFCKENLVTIESNTNLLEVAKLMKERHVGNLVVINNKFGTVAPLGIITDRDVVLAAADGKPLQSKRTDAYMTANLVTLKGSEGILEATALMSRQGVRRLPVVDDNGSLIGIVTADDFYQLLSSEFCNLAKICDLQVSREGRESVIAPSCEIKKKSA